MSQIKGCPTPPDVDDDVTELQEQVLILLEAAGIATRINDAIMKLVEAGERGAIAPDRFHVELDEYGTPEVIDYAGRRVHSRWTTRRDADAEAIRLNAANTGSKI